MSKVFIVAPVNAVLIQKLEAAGYECVLYETISLDDLYKTVHEAEGIITSNRIKIERQLIDAASQLRWIGRLGSGMEIIDVLYANEKNIQCFSSPEGNANAVAEQALGMLLALKHNIVRSCIEMKSGIWQREPNRGYELENTTVGIIGYGNNGSAFARKLTALGVRVLAYDKYINGFSENGIQACKDPDPIFEHATVVSFHVPLNSDTHHYFNHAFLNKFKHPFILLNLSRGQVVDTAAVSNGIDSGKITGAALDVWEYEPLNESPEPYLKLSTALLEKTNVIATPHIGGYTYEALYKMSSILADKIIASCH